MAARCRTYAESGGPPDWDGITHLTTEPYRPRTNGKVERFHQTMAPE